MTRGTIVAQIVNPLIACGVLAFPFAVHAAPENAVSAAGHRIGLEGDTVVVRSRFVLDRRPYAPLGLAAPLPAETVVDGATAQRDAQGRIVALDLDADADLTLRLSMAQAVEAGTLPLPVPSGDAVHRVVISPEIAFTPDPSTGLVAQLGRHVGPGIPIRARRHVDRSIDGRARLRPGAYYLRGDENFVGAGGFVGTVQRQTERKGRAAIWVGVVFVIAAGGLGLAHRRLRKRVELERAEAILEAEFENLEQTGSTELQQ